MEPETKPAYASKGVLGAIAAIVPSLFIALSAFGIVPDPAEATEAVLALIAAIGGVLALVGRLVATKGVRLF